MDHDTHLKHGFEEFLSTSHPLPGLVDVEVEHTQGIRLVLIPMTIIEEKLPASHPQNSNNTTVSTVEI